MSTSPRWSRPAINALHLLYQAGWRWAAISAHVSAVDGHPRTRRACISKAETLGIIDPARIAGATLSMPEYDDDIADMLILDYSLARMAAELSEQYGRRISGRFVHKRIKHLGSTGRAWRLRASQRRSKGQTGINRKGQGRAVA